VILYQDTKKGMSKGAVLFERKDETGQHCPCLKIPAPNSAKQGARVEGEARPVSKVMGKKNPISGMLKAGRTELAPTKSL